MRGQSSPKDIKMYDKTMDIAAKARTANLCQEIGQVPCAALSGCSCDWHTHTEHHGDKSTGSNASGHLQALCLQELKMVSIGGQLYGSPEGSSLSAEGWTLTLAHDIEGGSGFEGGDEIQKARATNAVTAIDPFLEVPCCEGHTSSWVAAPMLGVACADARMSLGIRRLKRKARMKRQCMLLPFGVLGRPFHRDSMKLRGACRGSGTLWMVTSGQNKHQEPRSLCATQAGRAAQDVAEPAVQYTQFVSHRARGVPAAGQRS
eukprot:3116788-Amphidinium_carterae.1